MRLPPEPLKIPACRNTDTTQTREETMSDLQAAADRVEIEALRGEFTDAVMTRDCDRVAALFTPDGVWRMPKIPVELAGREAIRAWGERVPPFVNSSCRPRSRARSGLTATPGPAVHTSKSSCASATGAAGFGVLAGHTGYPVAFALTAALVASASVVSQGAQAR